jgi:outer membrane immunogenic protein
MGFEHFAWGHAMKRILLTSLAAVALASSAAFAADLPAAAPVYKAPPAMAAPAFSWSGCYVDGGGGYGFLAENKIAVGAGFPTSSTSGSGRGWFGTVGAGCDYQMNANWVIGVQGDYNFMNVHGIFEDPFEFPGFFGTEKESSSWAVGGRIGYLIVPSVLAYFNGGYTQAHFDAITLTSGANPSVFGIAAHTYNGWFIGGGTEASLAGFFGLGLPPGLFLRSEYRFSSYQAGQAQWSGFGAPIIGNFEQSTKYVQTIGTALVWKFNWH